MNQKQFIKKFEENLATRFGITLNDVNEEAVLKRCKDGGSPEETVDWIGRKYDLDDITLSPYGLRNDYRKHKYL